MSKRASPMLIGGFVVGAFVLGLVAVTVLGSGRLFRETHEYVSYFDSSVNGLSVGSPVKFRGVNVGAVTDILLNLGGEDILEGVRVPVVFELDAAKITARGAQLDLRDPRTMEDLIRGGLRARLNTESIVTGMLYIGLDIHPGAPIDMVKPPGSPYQEIPAVPTILEEAQTAASELLAKFQEIDLAALIGAATIAAESMNEIVASPDLKSAIKNLDATSANLNRTIESIRTVARNVDGNVDILARSLQKTSDDAGAALEQARTTLESMRSMVQPGSPMTHQLGRTLQDVSAAARAVRALADYLERNPGAILRGRTASEEN